MKIGKRELIYIFIIIVLLGVIAFLIFSKIESVDKFLDVSSKTNNVEISSNSQSNLQKCEDSDNGLNYAEAGETCRKEECIRDSCLEGKLIEVYCNGGVVDIFSYTCPQGYECKEGACLEKIKPKEYCGDAVCQTGEINDCPIDCMPMERG